MTARHLRDDELPETAHLPEWLNPFVDLDLFMAHQLRWLADHSPLKLCEKGRRTGITFAQAWDDTLTAASSPAAGGDNCFYIGDSKEKGLEYVGYVKHFSRCIGETLREFVEYFFSDKRVDGTTRYITAYRARFVSGFAVSALSSRPANIRGLQGSVTIDEAAFHADVRATLAAVNALLIWGGKIRIISTHNGVRNPFNLLVEEARAGRSPFKLHRYSFADAVANGLYERVCFKRGIAATAEGQAEWKELILASYGSDEEARQEELFVQPSQNAGAWLPFDLILACEDDQAGKPELYQGGPCLIGNDIARRGDLWVAWVWEIVGDILWTREIVALKNTSFALQDAELDRLMSRYRARLAMDQTGMGEKPVEDAMRRYPGRVEGVILTGQVRLNIATIAKQGFEDRKLRIPDGDATLRADLHKLKRVTGETGHPRLVADRDAQGHADRAWAAFLGIALGDSGSAGIVDYYRAQVEKSPSASAAYAQIRERMNLRDRRLSTGASAR